LQTLDQAYQYIQEYTGFIYPGEFLIFFCGLFWRKASTRAALTTAIITIPLGILFKILFPGMPFILRIGYVFILLSFVMVGLSMMDKSQNINNILDERAGKKGINTGIRIVAIAMLVGIVAGFFVRPLKNLALEAIYVPIMMFILIGLILILNNTQKKMNIKAILIKKGLFNTSMTFNIAAIGICGILAALYYIFW
jgi:SSS family solute:Na+ symporter